MPDGFFRALPRAPGVYRFYDERDQLLYVGKSKELRARITSYSRAKPGDVSRKVVKLVHAIHRVEWEVLPDECAALLRENELIRKFDPPFNEANTRPDTYFFLGVNTLKLQGRAHIRLRITTKNVRRIDTLYGAFKSRGRLIRSFFALLRVSYWSEIAQDPDRPLLPPKRLQGGRIPPSAASPFPPEWLIPFREFLEGRSNRWLLQVADLLAPILSADSFLLTWLQQDIETLQDFFDQSLVRNADLARLAGQRDRLLAQEDVNDLIVKKKFMPPPASDPKIQLPAGLPLADPLKELVRRTK